MSNPLAILADFVYPRTCAGCGQSMTDRGLALCWDCRPKLNVIAPPMCQRCGEPVHGVIDHDYLCHTCTQRPPHYGRARAAIHYNNTGRAMLMDFKYNHALWLEPFLADLLETAVRSHYDGVAFDAVCAVPLHPVKQRERGYNQSRLLAAALARRLRVTLMGRRALQRVRWTPSQTRLTAGQRLTNVRGAFGTTNPAAWTSRRILLVDDVMTTGATVGACARVILDAGAASVDVITVARGI